ncbi:DUF2235 domain-containing protein [Marinobacter sp.]|uniref:T6SS phospholipase effector Tle1-like catalytic domain-containing protein n=1 Tax=Marinobacter sp. TaxID=50741 RepID=UPI0023526134|nr:DUF2235 domain-containing protein [Marinobacter sp.]
MRIKPFYRLQPAELPLMESPSAAARTVRRELSGPSAGRWLMPNPWDIPGIHPGTPQETLHQTLIARIAAGELCLVHSGIGTDVPLQPVVTWSEAGQVEGGVPGVGRWRCEEEGQQISGLVGAVADLNRRGVTPADLRAGTGMGSSSSQPQGVSRKDAPGYASTRDQDHRLSLPLGAAASVAPLPAQSATGQSAQPSSGVHLVAGLFTDGTLNNVENIKRFQQRLVEECVEPLKADPSRLEECRERLAMRLGESYANGPTNVVKLYDLYRDQDDKDGARRTVTVKAYESGAGTKTGDDDSVLGTATGLGETGVPAQVRRLFRAIVREIVRVTGKQVIESLTLDLFGFSRGAAAARHAAQEVLKGKEGELGKFMSAQGLGWPKQLDIRFMGLFDTVAGIVNVPGLDISAGNDRNGPVELYLDSGAIGQVVHLVAADERRVNFALNSVRNTDGSLPANFREITLPGAHSDIGGGYHDLETEAVLLHPTLTITGSRTRSPKETLEWDNLESLRAQVESEGWIGKYSLPLPDGRHPMLNLEAERDEHPLPDGRVELSLRMTRRVRGEYSRVGLHLMHSLARDAGVPLKTIPDREDLNIPSELRSLSAKILAETFEGDDRPQLDLAQLDLLRQRFIHHSDHYNLLEWLIADQVTGLEVPSPEFFHPLRPSTSGVRTTYPNKTSG